VWGVLHAVPALTSSPPSIVGSQDGLTVRSKDGYHPYMVDLGAFSVHVDEEKGDCCSLRASGVGKNVDRWVLFGGDKFIDLFNYGQPMRSDEQSEDVDVLYTFNRRQADEQACGCERKGDFHIFASKTGNPEHKFGGGINAQNGLPPIEVEDKGNGRKFSDKGDSV